MRARGDDLDHGLTGKHQSSFRNCIDIAGKLEVCQIIQEVRIEDLQTAKILDVLTAEMQILHIADQLLDAAHNGIAAPEGICAIESVENNGAVFFFVLEITLHHGQFVKIG